MPVFDFEKACKGEPVKIIAGDRVKQLAWFEDKQLFVGTVGKDFCTWTKDGKRDPLSRWTEDAEFERQHLIMVNSDDIMWMVIYKMRSNQKMVSSMCFPSLAEAEKEIHTLTAQADIVGSRIVELNYEGIGT